MRKLKLKKLSSAMLFIAIISMVIISGCSDDDPVVVPTDFTALNAKITEAETLIATTEEGSDVNQYANGSQVILQKVIGAAQVIIVIPTTTQTEADNTVIGLQDAIDVYLAGVVEPIDPTTLAAHWKFDEGTGTSVADFSGNGFDGSFKTGHTDFGGGTALWGTDRYGNANSALAVSDGAWVEVPYNAALNPSSAITVSLWVNPTVLGGRFMGLQSWIGYKFEVPDHGKPFFTVATDPDNDVFINEDASVAINAGEWVHIAVTYGGGEMVFYIDGDVARTVTGLTGNMAPVSGHNLAIGVETSRFADTDANYGDTGHADYHVIPTGWASIYNGSLDELRIYDVALTSPQVKSIYDDEK